MKKTILLFFVAQFLILSLNANAQTTSDNDDVQFWNETTLTFPLLKTTDKTGKKSTKLSGVLIGSLRVGRNVSDFVDERIGFGLDYKINKYFKFSPSYLYIAAQPSVNRKEFEHRLRFDFSAEKKWSHVTLKNRTRVEHRIRHSRSNSTRIRNRTQLVFPIKNSKGKEIFAPFVGDEVYYDFTEEKWSRNEFSAGIGKKFTNNFATEFFYLLRTNARPTSLRTVNVFGVNLKFTVD